jgi:hypothetical protein
VDDRGLPSAGSATRCSRALATPSARPPTTPRAADQRGRGRRSDLRQRPSGRRAFSTSARSRATGSSERAARASRRHRPAWTLEGKHDPARRAKVLASTRRRRGHRPRLGTQTDLGTQRQRKSSQMANFRVPRPRWDARRRTPTDASGNATRCISPMKASAASTRPCSPKWRPPSCRWVVPLSEADAGVRHEAGGSNSGRRTA